MPRSLAQRWHGLLRRAATHRWARRLEAYSFAIALERVAIEEGLRAATAVATLVAAAVWLDWPQLSWAALGAFWACLADPGGTDRTRLGFIGLFTVAGTLAAFVASATAAIGPWFAAAALVPLVFVPSVAAMYGVEAARVGTLVCVVAVVAVAFPNPPGAAAQLAGLFLSGCVCAMVLCVGIWRIHRYAPARRAIATVFAQLVSMTAELLALDASGRPTGAEWDRFNAEHRRSIRAMLERARSIVAVLETSDPRYRFEIEGADRIFAALVAIGHALAERGTGLDASGERDLLHRLVPLLAQAQHQAIQRTPEGALLSSQARALQAQSFTVANVIGRGIGAAARALDDLADAWQDAPRSAPLRASEGPGRREILKPIPARALSHAVRVAIAVVTAYALGSSLNLTFSYWATMAAVVVVQPEAATIWQRSLERMAGSVAGGLLAALLMFLLPNKLELLGLIFPIAAATIAFRLVNYAIFVLFVTALFVLVTELLQPAAGIASIRVLDNVIGSLVGLAASLLLRRASGAQRPGEVLAQAVKANFLYTAAVIGAAADADNLRRAAGLASNAAETVRYRMTMEGRGRRARVAEMTELLHALRRLAGSAIAASLAGRPADAMRATAVRRQGEMLAQALERPAAAPASTVFTEPGDDIDRAIGSVTEAVAAYVEALRASPVARGVPQQPAV